MQYARIDNEPNRLATNWDVWGAECGEDLTTGRYTAEASSVTHEDVIVPMEHAAPDGEHPGMKPSPVRNSKMQYLGLPAYLSLAKMVTSVQRVCEPPPPLMNSPLMMRWRVNSCTNSPTYSDHDRGS